MKIIYAYVVTSSLLTTFQHCQKNQSELFPDAVKGVDQVIFTDPANSHAREWFIPVLGLIEGERYCHALALNAAMIHAMREGADWLVLLNADTVMINPILQWPESGFGFVSSYFMKKDEAFSPLPTEFLETGQYILHESVFSKYCFCEDFIGWGYEDCDFKYQLIRNGIEPSKTDALSFHVWHERRNTRSRGEINRLLCEKRTGVPFESYP